MGRRVKVTIDGKVFSAEEGESLLAVALRNGIDIPHLCYEECLEPYGSCRLCIVEVVEGFKKGITTSCTLGCVDGLKVLTNTPEIEKHRKVLFELYLAQAPNSEKLKKLAEKFGVYSTRFKEKNLKNDPLNGKCVMCGLCVRVCNDVLGVGAINFIGRGYRATVNVPYFEESDVCKGCKACVEVCPVDAIDYSDVGDKRVMISWSNTKVDLIKCSVCGRYFSPLPVFGSVSKKLSEYGVVCDVCPDCRKRLIAKNMTSSGGYNSYA